MADEQHHEDITERPTTAVPLAGVVWVHPDDLRLTFTRSGGPGGQHVNKVSTRCELRVRVADLRELDAEAADRLRAMAGRRLLANDDVRIISNEHRTQIGNRRACLARLAALVQACLVAPRRRRKVRPTRGMIERRLERKRQRSQKKSRRRWRSDDS